MAGPETCSSEIRSRIDKMLRITDAAAGDPAMASDEFFAQGMQLISSPEAQAAFDIHREPGAIRNAYGRHPFGQRALLARRLVSGDRGFERGHLRIE